MSNKYGAKKTVYNGATYDSRREADYARELDIRKRAADLRERVARWERQVRYSIVLKGRKICSYYLDFRVWYADGRVEHVDVKGVRTQTYILKKKLIEAVYNIKIKEV